MKKPASQIQVGEKVNRFGHLHPVLAVAIRQHPIAGRDVIEVTHDLGKVCYTPEALVEVLP